MYKNLHFLTLFVTFLCFSSSLQAQFNLQGTGFSTGGNRCYEMTKAIDFQATTLWSQEKINLNRNFDILAKVNFGDKNNSGGDGMTFAFGRDNKYLDSWNGSGIGLLNLTPSLIVEMDTYSNGDKSDPLNDHLGVHKNGTFQHNTTNNLVPPVNFLAGGGSLNVEDGLDHILRITWNAKDTTLVVYFDCVQRISLKNNIKRIFGNDHNVYWGFSGASGLNNNKQTLCVLRSSALDEYHEKTLCEGAQAIEMDASYGKSFSWSPNNDISSTSIRNPMALPTATTIYVAKVQHECNLTFNDTFKIIRPRLTPNDWTTNAAICDDKKLTLDATAPDAKTYTWNPFNDKATQEVKTTGFYQVSISDGICTKVVSADITVNPAPIFSLGADVDVCEGSPVSLDATVINATYAWNTGASSAKISVSKSGKYVATVTSDKGCTQKDSVDVVIRPTSKFTETKSICEGTSYTFEAKKYSKDTTLKATYVATNGCDSFYTLKLTILKKSYATLSQRLCEGNEYDFFGEKLKKSGTYIKKFVAANGCDSIYTLTLKVINSDTSKTKEYICKNSSYSIANQTFDKDGVYPVKLKNSIGCDSFVIVTLTVDKGLGHTYKDTICNGFTYLFDGKNLTTTGNYDKVLKNQKGCDSIVTLQLFVKNSPPVILSTTKKILCENDEATLTASGTYAAYKWNQASASSNSLVAKTEGVYRVSVTDETGCIGYDSIVIQKSNPMTINVLAKTPSCSGYSDGQIEIKTIDGGIAPFQYSFDGKDFTNKTLLNNLKEGNYTTYVKDAANCEAKITSSLQNPIPKNIRIAENSLSITLGDSALATILPTFKDVASVTWLPSITKSSDPLETWLKPTRSTRYTVWVADSLGCKFSDTVSVTVDTRLKMFIPTAFSANFDGTNDEFRPFSGSSVAKIVSFRVFDRWGNQVFEALDLKPSDTLGWDGTFRDTPLVEGIYTYHVKALKLDDEIEDVIGEVMLMR